MPLPVANTPISFSQIQTEFGGVNPISMSEYYRGRQYVTPNNAGVPVADTLAISRFFGTVKEFVFVNTLNYTVNPNLRSLAIAAGWDGEDYLVVVNNGIFSSSLTANPALTISGSFPNGIKFINNGYILGMGGAGANQETIGLPGGPALSVSTSVTIENNGIIAGGGGGGGAGSSWGWNGYNRSSPGSGGASGLVAAARGSSLGNVLSERGIVAYPSVDSNGDGIFETPGASFNWGWGGRASSPGGKGGNWGLPGDAGGTVDGVYNFTGYAGGAGGAAVTGNNNVTWQVPGTRYGSLVA